jgi:ER lumen protein retaining receptor
MASSGYTVYLMLNDYKPTQDPGLDTFKIQYLLGGAAVLAILFPYEYSFSEVGKPHPTRTHLRGA